MANASCLAHHYNTEGSVLVGVSDLREGENIRSEAWVIRVEHGLAVKGSSPCGIRYICSGAPLYIIVDRRDRLTAR